MDYDATNRKHIKVAQQEAKLADRDRDQFLGAVMDTAQGRAWMWDRLASANIFHTCFNTNALTMAMLEGRRDTGLRDLNDILRVAPDQFILMVREAHGRQSLSDARRTASSREQTGTDGTEPNRSDSAEHATAGEGARSDANGAAEGSRYIEDPEIAYQRGDRGA